MIDEAGNLPVQERDEMYEIREIDEVAHEGLAIAGDDRPAIGMRRRAVTGQQLDEEIGDIRCNG